MNYEELINAAKANDNVAFMALWNTIDPRSVAALRRGVSREDWEDIEQEAKLDFWKALQNIAHFDNLPEYLYVILKNTKLRYIAQKSKMDGEPLVEYVGDLVEDGYDVPDECSDPAIQAEISSLLRYIKRRLSEEEYSCWRLATQHGYTIDEIAQKTGIHRSSVHRHIQRAEKKVVDIMREEGYDEDFLLQWEHSNVPMDIVIEDDE